MNSYYSHVCFVGKHELLCRLQVGWNPQGTRILCQRTKQSPAHVDAPLAFPPSMPPPLKGIGHGVRHCPFRVFLWFDLLLSSAQGLIFRVLGMTFWDSLIPETTSWMVYLRVSHHFSLPGHRIVASLMFSVGPCFQSSVRGLRTRNPDVCVLLGSHPPELFRREGSRSEAIREVGFPLLSLAEMCFLVSCPLLVLNGVDFATGLLCQWARHVFFDSVFSGVGRRRCSPPASPHASATTLGALQRRCWLRGGPRLIRPSHPVALFFLSLNFENGFLRALGVQLKSIQEPFPFFPWPLG